MAQAEKDSPQRRAVYLKQVVSIIYAIAENNVGTTKLPDKDYYLLIAGECNKYVMSNRYNIDFADKIQARVHLFSAWFTATPLDDELQELLSECFPSVITTALAKKYSEGFSAVKTFSRNEMGPLYLSAISKVHSGEYRDDEDIIIILKKFINY